MNTESEFELIDLGGAKGETKGMTALAPRDENPAFPFGFRPPGTD